MKNLIKTIAFTIILGSSHVFAGSLDDKMKTSDIKKVLPENIPSLEAPAPEKTKVSKNQPNYSAAQKAAIVELKLENQK